jgi:hypothetical protein
MAEGGCDASCEEHRHGMGLYLVSSREAGRTIRLLPPGRGLLDDA